jgi:hypothetical protein
MNGWKRGAPTASDAKTTLVPLSAQPVASIPRIKVSYPPENEPALAGGQRHGRHILAMVVGG